MLKRTDFLTRLYGKPEAFKGLLYSGVGHVYTADMWRELLGWMDQNLKT